MENSPGNAVISLVCDAETSGAYSCRMLKRVLLTRPTSARQDAPFRRQSRSKRRGEAYPLGYVEDLNEVRTMHGKRARLGAPRVGRV
jgi:hypothetical protein